MSQRDQLASLVSELCTTYRVDMELELIERYTEALSDIDFSLVELAVAELIKESDWMPKASEIRRAAKRIQASSSDKPAEPEHWRKDKYDCRECRDTGWISVWHPRAIAAARAYVADHLPEDKFRRNLYEAAAKCRCERGQKRLGEIATFDPNVHARITAAGHANRVGELLDWTRQYRPPNHVPEFEDWSAQAAQNPF